MFKGKSLFGVLSKVTDMLVQCRYQGLGGQDHTARSDGLELGLGVAPRALLSTHIFIFSCLSHMNEDALPLHLRSEAVKYSIRQGGKALCARVRYMKQMTLTLSCATRWCSISLSVIAPDSSCSLALPRSSSTRGLQAHDSRSSVESSTLSS